MRGVVVRQIRIVFGQLSAYRFRVRIFVDDVRFAVRLEQVKIARMMGRRDNFSHEFKRMRSFPIQTEKAALEKSPLAVFAQRTYLFVFLLKRMCGLSMILAG